MVRFYALKLLFIYVSECLRHRHVFIHPMLGLLIKLLSIPSSHREVKSFFEISLYIYIFSFFAQEFYPKFNQFIEDFSFHKYLVETQVHTSDGFELEFSGSSEPEL